MKTLKYKVYRKTALIMAFILLIQIWMPTITWALSSGPSTPEVQSFEPVGTSQMVDLFSGDFNYNIPLLEVGGYPINIAYHAGPGLEQEASWVGLGWNLNPGSILRNMRGIPDDFSGEVIEKEVNILPNRSVSFLVNPEVELLGKEIAGTKEKKRGPKLGFTTGVRYNNYRGISMIGKANIGLDISLMGAFNLNLNLGADLENGISFVPSLSTSFKIDENKGDGSLTGNINIGAPYNSRQGMSEMTFTKGFSNFQTKQSSNKFRKIESTIGASITTTLATFNTPSYITKSDFDSRSFSFSANFAAGGEVPFANIESNLEGAFSTHRTIGSRNLKAYGYLNQHLADPESDLLDFNREKEGPFFLGTGVLPIANITNDVFSVSGQGMGGVFRGFRNQINYVTDPIATNNSTDGSTGAEIGIPLSPITFKGGSNISIHALRSTSGLWQDDNLAINTFNRNTEPTSNDIDRIKFEHSYFKQLGELSVDNDRYDNLGKKEPLAVSVFPNFADVTSPQLSNQFTNRKGNLQAISPVTEKRVPRNQLTYTKSFDDVIQENRDREIRSYSIDQNDNLDYETRTIEEYKNVLNDYGMLGSQTFEYSVLRPDGMRYIYGLPAFNLSKEEVTFNIGADKPKAGTNGYVTYTDADANANANSNTHGLDNFVSIDRMPAYSYTHHLTEVVSPDYRDLTGDGPSDDDYGNWVKFNYAYQAGPLFSSGGNYSWRFPMTDNDILMPGEDGLAVFNEGLKSRDNDNKASYTYGEKEKWYLQSIESRTHIAVFYTSITGDRNDARQASSSRGGVDLTGPNLNQQLDRIEYYSKNDVYENGVVK